MRGGFCSAEVVPKIANSTIGFQESKPEKAICEFTEMDFVSSLPKAKGGETLESKVAHKALYGKYLML
jgi:hypothetical protein